MNIYAKLNEARKEFHSTKLTKSGRNKFSGYSYFELGDFLVPAIKILAKHKLCAVVSFSPDVASMKIHDTDDVTQTIVINSPMGSASLKGCHEVQNIGAVETYQRRYLWIAALEVVEHDALDAVTGKDDKNPFTPEPPKLHPDTEASLEYLATQIVNLHEAGAMDDMLEIFSSVVDNDAKLVLWNFLKPHSKVRSTIKRLTEQGRLATPEPPKLDTDTESYLDDLATQIVNLHEAGSMDEMMGLASGVVDNDQKLVLWNFLKPHSKVRSAIKRFNEQERLAEQAGYPTPGEPSNVDAAGTYTDRITGGWMGHE